MIKQFHANLARQKRHRRMRRSLAGSPERPRLNVFRSGKHIYAQVIDDSTGQTLVAASTLDESLRNFKPQVVAAPTRGEQKVEEAPVEMAASAAPAKGKGAKAAKAPAKGAQPQKGKGGQPAAQVKTVLPSAQKRATKTPVEALVAIANNRKVAMAREVGKLVGQRARALIRLSLIVAATPIMGASPRWPKALVKPV